MRRLSRRAAAFRSGDFELGHRVCLVERPEVVGVVVYLGPGPVMEVVDGRVVTIEPFSGNWRRLDDFLVARGQYAGPLGRVSVPWASRRYLGKSGVVVRTSPHCGGERLLSPARTALRRTL